MKSKQNRVNFELNTSRIKNVMFNILFGEKLKKLDAHSTKNNLTFKDYIYYALNQSKVLLRVHL